MTINTIQHSIGHYEVNEPFCDGIVYIVSEKTVEKIYLHAEFDEPLTLDGILQKYPEVEMVIYDCYLGGAIYRYNNYGDGNWHKVGETIGFA